MGITPARAGKTAFSAHPCTVHGDHPRSCGKDRISSLSSFCNLGSPPLVRERLNWMGQCFFQSGITPARAGKTQLDGTVLLSKRDHPRSCGKDVVPCQVVNPLRGSPPLVRERQEEAKRRFDNFRITPARAGKTMNSTWMTMKLQDHPRSCGKDHCAFHSFRSLLGSPPLVRERPAKGVMRMYWLRITPARAGKTNQDVL